MNTTKKILVGCFIALFGAAVFAGGTATAGAPGASSRQGRKRIGAGSRNCRFDSLGGISRTASSRAAAGGGPTSCCGAAAGGGPTSCCGAAAGGGSTSSAADPVAPTSESAVSQRTVLSALLREAKQPTRPVADSGSRFLCRGARGGKRRSGIPCRF